MGVSVEPALVSILTETLGRFCDKIKTAMNLVLVVATSGVEEVPLETHAQKPMEAVVLSLNPKLQR